MDINGLITAGYVGADILDLLSKNNPQASKAIRKTLRAGYGASQIINYLLGGKEDQDESYMTQEEKINAGHERQKRKALNKLIFSAGALGAGLGSLASRSIGAAAQAVPEVAGTAAEVAPIAAQAISSQQLPTTAGQSPLSAQTIRQQAAQLGMPKETMLQEQPVEMIQPFLSPEEIQEQEKRLEKMYPVVKSFTEKHKEAGKSPEETYSRLKESKLIAPIIDKFEKGTGQSYLETLKKSFGQEVPIKVGSPVIMPNGMIGDVSHEKLGTSIVQTPDKKHAIKTDELQTFPNEWSNLQVDLSAVPEEAKSAPISKVAATDDKKQLIMDFWAPGSKEPKLYIYQRKDGKPIDEEILKSISEETDVPISNGMKFSGAWSTGGKSRGSAFHHKMKMLAQSIDETDDPSKPYVFTRAPVTFKHGFYELIDKQLAELEKKFNAFYQSPKKKKK